MLTSSSCGTSLPNPAPFRFQIWSTARCRFGAILSGLLILCSSFFSNSPSLSSTGHAFQPQCLVRPLGLSSRAQVRHPAAARLLAKCTTPTARLDAAAFAPPAAINMFPPLSPNGVCPVARTREKHMPLGCKYPMLDHPFPLHSVCAYAQWRPSATCRLDVGLSDVLPLSPRKLHPVLRAERAEKDRFATGQKNYFFGCLMNVILDVVK